jgi:SAM-dependent methyltransferase
MSPDYAQDAGGSGTTNSGKLSKFSPYARTDSVSSASATSTSLRSGATMTSSEVEGGLSPTKPFTLRNGRTYLNDPTLPYPLPVDLAELHRQSLRTLLMIQVFGGPVCSPTFASRPPMRVLEVGCGSGFWSMMCHRYYAQKGHGNIHFTGIDIGPIAPGSAPHSSSSPSKSSSSSRPDRDMRWRFVQHDMRATPFPLPADEFDLVMVKDMSLATTNAMQQRMMDEYLRVLRPGGTLEIWESDHTVRMLRPHALDRSGATPGEEEDEHEVAASLGAYVMTANTPLSAPLNNYLVEYNSWVHRALEARDLSAVPCTLVGPMLLQESEELVDVRSRRLAIPLSEVRWEREGVGGVVTKGGKSYIDTNKGKGRSGGADLSTSGELPSYVGRGMGREGGGSGSAMSPVGAGGASKALTNGQQALRRTALLTVVQMVQSLEPLLREVSGKSQDEWDVWIGKMLGDVMGEQGTAWGECLEVGAWWARKKK